MVKKVRAFKVISLMRKLKAAKVIPSSIVPNYENSYRVSLTFLNIPTPRTRNTGNQAGVGPQE
ncbi:hypothetical protein pipiens_012084, partial [Culex pipiens pipiens]